MKERPILFSAPMVRAILAGTKTQTRRVVKPQPFRDPSTHGYQWHGGAALLRAEYGDRYVHTDLEPMRRAAERCCPYGQPGDRLWIRETFGVQADCTIGYQKFTSLKLTPSAKERPKIHYRSDNNERAWVEKWRPSIHMHRWASRITLEVTDVRVERLQDISEADAVAEGVKNSLHLPGGRFASENYCHLWDTINGEGSWDTNPWVWVVSFKRIEKGSKE